MAQLLKNLKEPPVLLFDWDGTLADNWPAILAAKNEVRAAFGLNAIDITTYHRHYGSAPTRDIFLRMLRENSSEHRIDAALQLYDMVTKRDHLQNMGIIPGAFDVILALKQAGFKMGIVSNKEGTILREQIAALGLTKCFDAVVGAGEAGKGNDKPMPMPLHLAARQMNALPLRKKADFPNIFMIGDSLTDMEAAHYAGFVPVLVNTDPKEINSIYFQPHASFSNLYDLAAAFGVNVPRSPTPPPAQPHTPNPN